MNRRHFLSVLSAGAVGTAFLRLAGAEEEGGDAAVAAKARKLAIDALARAKQNGKPLLVLVIPSETRFVWKRGDLFGTWLSHADDALLADLALFEIACLPASALEGASIRELEHAKDALMLLIETHESEPRAIAIHGEVPQQLDQDMTGFSPHGETLADVEVRANAAIRKRDALVSNWLRDAAKLDERLPQLAKQAQAALSDAQREALAKHAAQPGKIEAAVLLRGAAVLRHAATTDPHLSPGELTRAVAKAAADAIKAAPPLGARWASHTGCGFTFEVPSEQDGSHDAGALCGTGFVSKDGKRFLYFFVQRVG